MKNIKTIIHYYRFDVSEREQKEAYQLLCDKLRGFGLLVFDGISMDQGKWLKSIRPLDGKEIELETSYIFNNQWNTAPIGESKTGLRVFDWSEEIYPNKRLKEGMWLEQNDQMKEVRQNTFTCGWCGKNHYKPTIEFCNACLDGEYLKESDLYLLKLVRVVDEDKATRKGASIPQSLIAEYRQKQLYAETVTRPNRDLKKSKKRLNEDVKEITAKVERLNMVLAVLKWADSENLNTKNWIVYDHRQTICIGWQGKQSPAMVKEWQKLFADKKCPFESVITFETE